jgi:cytochrome c551/c552
MSITSILRTGLLTLALGASLASVAPAFAGSVSDKAQLHQSTNTGIYDGAAWDAAKNAPNG